VGSYERRAGAKQVISTMLTPAERSSSCFCGIRLDPRRHFVSDGNELDDSYDPSARSGVDDLNECFGADSSSIRLSAVREDCDAPAFEFEPPRLTPETAPNDANVG